MTVDDPAEVEQVNEEDELYLELVATKLASARKWIKNAPHATDCATTCSCYASWFHECDCWKVHALKDIE